MTMDRMPDEEKSILSSDVTKRWREAWEVVSAQYAGGTSLREISEIFLKSVFRPDLLADLQSNTIYLEKVGHLKSPSILALLKPNESLLNRGMSELVQKVLTQEPILVPNAMETIEKLVEKSQFHIWTVGDYVGTQANQLPQESGQLGGYEGSGHQLWKLYQAGLTNREGITNIVADNKFLGIVSRISFLEGEGVKKFIFYDDRLSNLKKLQGIIDQENMDRETMGDTPLSCKLVLVNQGSRRSQNPEHISTHGSLTEFEVINNFYEAETVLEALPREKQAVFCDFDGTITDNGAVRNAWDQVASEVVEEIADLAKIRNLQKEVASTVIQDSDLTLDAITPYIDGCRSHHLKIGVKNGAYDILQPGHVRGFEIAHDACDVLIVLLNSDASMRKYKGEKAGVPRPIVDQRQRAATLLGLESVDGVIVFDDENPAEMIRKIKPDVYVTSEEYRGKPLKEFAAADEIGAEVVYTDYVVGYSTSGIVEKIALALRNKDSATYIN